MNIIFMCFQIWQIQPMNTTKIMIFLIVKGIVISAHEHIKKSDEKIFNILLDRYSLKAEECLFIDDDDTGKSDSVANSIGILEKKLNL